MASKGNGKANGKKRGPNFTATDEQRRQVQTCAGCGCTDEDISLILDIGESTLKRHFRKEIKTGRAKARAKVMQTCYQMAISGEHWAVTMFWLKCRAGWRETDIPVEERKEPPKNFFIRELAPGEPMPDEEETIH